MFEQLLSTACVHLPDKPAGHRAPAAGASSPAWRHCRGPMHRPISRRATGRHAVGLAITAVLFSTGAQAFEIQSYARTTLSSVFPTAFSDIETSNALPLTSVSASQNGPDPGFGHFESFSAIDLAAGTMKGKSVVTNSNASTLPGLESESTGHLYETVVVNAPPVPPPPASIPFVSTLKATGSFSSLSGEGNAYAYFSLSINGSGSYFVVSCNSACSAVNVFVNPGVTVVNASPNAWEVDLTQSVMVAPGTSVDLHYDMSTQALSYGAGSATLDASHTARLAVSLPPDYSFTSGSGVFLTAASVPEPDSAWLLLAGLAGMSLMARRRRLAIPRLRGCWPVAYT